MNIENGSKLFVVEFGKPDNGGWISFGSNGQQPVYVIAKTYDEAATKAMIYAESKSENKSVVDYDGSLKTSDCELRVKAVKLACDEFIW